MVTFPSRKKDNLSEWSSFVWVDMINCPTRKFHQDKSTPRMLMTNSILSSAKVNLHCFVISKISRLWNSLKLWALTNTCKIFCSTLSDALTIISRMRPWILKKSILLASLRGFRDTCAQLDTMVTVQCYLAFMEAVNMLKPLVEQVLFLAMSTSLTLRSRSVNVILNKIPTTQTSKSSHQWSTPTTILL